MGLAIFLMGEHTHVHPLYHHHHHHHHFQLQMSEQRRHHNFKLKLQANRKLSFRFRFRFRILNRPFLPWFSRFSVPFCSFLLCFSVFWSRIVSFFCRAQHEIKCAVNYAILCFVRFAFFDSPRQNGWRIKGKARRKYIVRKKANGRRQQQVLTDPERCNFPALQIHYSHLRVEKFFAAYITYTHYIDVVLPQCNATWCIQPAAAAAAKTCITNSRLCNRPSLSFLL